VPVPIPPASGLRDNAATRMANPNWALQFSQRFGWKNSQNAGLETPQIAKILVPHPSTGIRQRGSSYSARVQIVAHPIVDLTGPPATASLLFRGGRRSGPVAYKEVGKCAEPLRSPGEGSTPPGPDATGGAEHPPRTDASNEAQPDLQKE
jgi:hypothetical protein